MVHRQHDLVVEVVEQIILAEQLELVVVELVVVLHKLEQQEQLILVVELEVLEEQAELLLHRVQVAVLV